MGRYSIKELEQLSGIKAHTIRIWEKRYKLIEPLRTDTNIRYYSDDDLKKIISVSVLNSNGVKISKIASLTAQDIFKKVTDLSESQNSIDIYIEQLILSMIDLDEEEFEKIFGSLIAKVGFEKTLIEIIYPFLQKIGVLWLTDNITPAQEHFVSNLIRQKIITAIDGLPIAPKSAKRVLLYLPENELHEIALLFFHYIARHLRFKTYYLGQTVPFLSLKSVYSEHHPNIIVSSFTSAPSAHALQAYINKLGSEFSSAQILVTGALLRKPDLSFPPNFKIFQTAGEFKDILNQI